MTRLLSVGVVCVLLSSTVWGLDLTYDCPPGTKLIRNVKESGEFLVLGTLPGTEQLIGTIKGTRKIMYSVEEGGGDYALVKIRGRREVDIDTDSMFVDPLYDDVGPATLKVNREGDVLGVELGKFNADPDSMMQFGWLHYIEQQLDLVEGLPPAFVSKDDTWQNQTKLQSPAGGTITLTSTSKLIGEGFNDGRCAWIESTGVLPLDLRFKTAEGTYTVKGEIELFSVSCFNLEKGLITNKKSYHLARLAVESKAAKDSYGEDFSIRLVGAFQAEAVISEEKTEAKAVSVGTDRLAVMK